MNTVKGVSRVNTECSVNAVNSVNDVNTPTVEVPTDLPPLDEPTFAGTS